MNTLYLKYKQKNSTQISQLNAQICQTENQYLLPRRLVLTLVNEMSRTPTMGLSIVVIG